MMFYNPFQLEMCICTSEDLAVCEQDRFKTFMRFNYAARLKKTLTGYTSHTMSCTTVPSKCLDQKYKKKKVSLLMFSGGI